MKETRQAMHQPSFTDIYSFWELGRRFVSMNVLQRSLDMLVGAVLSA